MNEQLEATLRRLRDERDEADRRYNEALTALDAALPPHTAVPDPHAALDEHQLATLNDAWNILPAPPAGGGLQGKLTGLIWRTVAPYLQRQLTFNSVLVDHINRTVEAQRAAHRRDIERTEALRTHVNAVAGFHARLMGYFQQFTAYVDTKDRDAGGGALVLNAAMGELAESQGKYRESLAAREHRYEARTTALIAAHEELRGMLGVAQHAIAALKRHVASNQTAGSSAAAGTASASLPSTGAAEVAFSPSLDAYKYVGFEDQFRGSEAVIRKRQESYLPFFARLRQGSGAAGPLHQGSGAAGPLHQDSGEAGPLPQDSGEARAPGDVLDIGCGRGEFIALLVANGIPARGIDLNHEMAELCRARGLDVTEADAVTYLAELPDGSLGGIFAAQVVEHLEPAYLLRLLDLAFVKLQPGGTLVLETLNPACWTAFFESYIRDITHRWPLHPETLKYLVTASGFTRATIEFRSPVPEQDKLQRLPPHVAGDEEGGELVEAFNANVEKLNARIFTYMDYAVIGVKGDA